MYLFGYTALQLFDEKKKLLFRRGNDPPCPALRMPAHDRHTHTRTHMYIRICVCLLGRM